MDFGTDPMFKHGIDGLVVEVGRIRPTSGRATTISSRSCHSC